MDKRDVTTWIAIELSPLGEQKVKEGTLESTLRQDLGADSNFPIFIPATTFYKDSRTVSIILMEGYAFVSSGLPDVRYFSLEKRGYVSQILSTTAGKHNVRVLVSMPDSKIQALREKLSRLLSAEVEVGSTVRITGGKYRNLDGPVIGFDSKGNAIVTIKLRSWIRNAHIPQVFLEPMYAQ